MKRSLVFFFSFCLGFLSFVNAGVAAGNTTAPLLAVPQLTGPVVDESGIFSGTQRERLSQLLNSVWARHKVQLQILVIPTLQDEPIENFSIRVMDQWKLGEAKKDNGVLFLIVINDRKSRIEVGRGLEGDLPDVIAKRIQADVLRPYFKQGAYQEGILQGVLEILKYADPEFQPGISSPAPRRSGKLPIGVVVIFILAILVLQIFFGGGSGFYGGGGFGGGSSGGWGGSGGGGSWGGGGGGFSGGGASDSW